MSFDVTKQIEKATTAITNSLYNLKETIRLSTESSEKVSGRIFFLNVVLTAATAIGAIATLLLVFK